MSATYPISQLLSIPMTVVYIITRLPENENKIFETSKHEENPRYFDYALGQTSREIAMSWMNGLFSLIRHPLNDELTIL